MTPDLFRALAITPALALLPARMDTPAARALLVAIALQESKLESRLQIHGPARSYFQFERAGVRGVLTHVDSHRLAQGICEALDIPPSVDRVFSAIAYHDVLAAACARLLLWTDAAALPDAAHADAGWQLYLRTWRPGKPHPATWPAHFARGWSLVCPV